MRISDWSSDVCSSDLEELAAVGPPDAGATAQLEVGEPDGGEPAVQRRTRGAWGHQALDQGRPALQAPVRGVDQGPERVVGVDQGVGTIHELGRDLEEVASSLVGALGEQRGDQNGRALAQCDLAPAAGRAAWWERGCKY